jgi:lipoate synthase
MGECERNAAFMTKACARSCGVCKVAQRPADDELDDELDEADSKDEL